MHLNALLDLDVVAMETEDRISVLLDLTAPTVAGRAQRSPAALEVVLDRSGSMADGRLEAAQHALFSLVDRLDPTDHFGLVAFDSNVDVAVPAGPLHDKNAVKHRIASLYPGSMTNLSSGLARGLQEARRATDGQGATLLLLSDGHANEGVVDHAQLERLAASGRERGITVSTVGIGLDYDEALMATIARGAAGNTHFAENGDEAGGAVASEVDGLLEQVVQAASLIVRPTADVDAVRLFNDLPAAAIEGGFMVELGDFYAGEERRLLLEVDVPGIPSLGLAQVCELELRWVDIATLDTHVATIPINVNVVPGDEATGRLPNPTVRTEMAFQQAQRAKRDAADALRRGDADAASRIYDDAGTHLMACSADAPELVEEANVLRDLAGRARVDDVRRTAKLSEADRHRKERRRGRDR